MTQGKLSVNNKPANPEGQQGNAERKEPSAPAVPPTYEEATSAEGMKAGAFSPPLNVPLHPTWAYVDPRNTGSVHLYWKNIAQILVYFTNITCYYNTTSVLLCLGITTLVCLSVTLFSFQTKYDFTSCQGVLFVMLMVLLFSGIILAFMLPFHYVPWLQAIYAVLGAVVFTMFLAFDTQLLMGNRRYAMSPEEYIFGALNIYLDIIYIFSFLLQIFGSSRD
ncbi:PREDICTED: protein lifeguard 2 [Thamnophis sirtalis]|uniref:Protein lifeguard 2 n=1 Tax=Thamnophis sirtalis TaxID=35019 RepID=A0A6I9Z630_9SAUR|nr:PREDICTED: protein lifeguard 2 [Thamnophis sirtalis]